MGTFKNQLKEEFEMCSNHCKDYFDFVEHFGEILSDYESLGLIKDYSFGSDHIFNSPDLNIYVVSIAVIVENNELFHDTKVFSLKNIS